MESDPKQIPSATLSRLIGAVEQTFGRSPKTPKDFDQLRESVYRRTSVLLSPTTLKRLWGYLGEKVVPRRQTLDVLSRYAGWRDFSEIDSSKGEPESGPLSLERINISGGELQSGDRLTVAWLPDREIEIEYLGEGRFRILSALNTRLEVGDFFETGIIAKDQPMYFDRLTRNGTDLGVYVGGRQSGIRFIRQDEKD